MVFLGFLRDTFSYFWRPPFPDPIEEAIRSIVPAPEGTLGFNLQRKRPRPTEETEVDRNVAMSASRKDDDEIQCLGSFPSSNAQKRREDRSYTLEGSAAPGIENSPNGEHLKTLASLHRPAFKWRWSQSQRGPSWKAKTELSDGKGMEPRSRHPAKSDLFAGLSSDVRSKALHEDTVKEPGRPHLHRGGLGAAQRPLHEIQSKRLLPEETSARQQTRPPIEVIDLDKNAAPTSPLTQHGQRVVPIQLIGFPETSIEPAGDGAGKCRSPLPMPSPSASVLDPIARARARLNDRLLHGRPSPLVDRRTPTSPLLRKQPMKRAREKKRGVASIADRISSFFGVGQRRRLGGEDWNDILGCVRLRERDLYRKWVQSDSNFFQRSRPTEPSVSFRKSDPSLSPWKSASLFPAPSPKVAFLNLSSAPSPSPFRSSSGEEAKEEDEDVQVVAVRQGQGRSPSQHVSDLQRRIQSMKELEAGYLDNAEIGGGERRTHLNASIETAHKRDVFLKNSRERVLLHQENQRQMGQSLEAALREKLRVCTEAPEKEEIFYVPEEPEEVEEDPYPPLDDEALALVSNALGPGGPEELLVKEFNIPIHRKDIRTLRPGTWLNDEVINFFFNLVQERSERCRTQKSPKIPFVYIQSTFFLATLNKGYQFVRRWTRSVDIFERDLLLIPVHLGQHWTLAVVHVKDKIIRYYDSLLGDNPVCLALLLDYLEKEMADKKKTVLIPSEWKMETPKDIPEQLNGSDCGVFCCRFAEVLSRGKAIDFTQTDMPYFRKRMVTEILSKKLLN